MHDKASHTIVMRKIVLGLHSIVIVCSVAMFAYTFFAKDHLIGHARHVVTEKTLSHAEPIIDAMRNSLDDALAQKILSMTISARPFQNSFWPFRSRCHSLPSSP